MAVYKDKKRGTWYVSVYYTDWKGENARKVKRGFKTRKTGRRRFDSETLLKVILFAFMEHGYVSTREIDNFMNYCLTDNIKNIFNEINRYIFNVQNVD